MTMWVRCPYLGTNIELTDERREHILERHPDLLPDYIHRIAETVSDPDVVRRDKRFPSTRLLSRHYDDARRNKHLVVVVVSDDRTGRHWIVTAYITGRVRQGDIEWTRT